MMNGVLETKPRRSALASGYRGNANCAWVPTLRAGQIVMGDIVIALTGARLLAFEFRPYAPVQHRPTSLT